MQKFRKMKTFKYIFAISCFLLLFNSEAWANIQNQIKRNLTVVIGENYKLVWEPQVPSTTIDSTPSLIEGQAEGIHQPEEFQVYMKCLSTNGPLEYIGSVGNTTYEMEIENNRLSSGYVYEAVVRPVHYHIYEDAEGLRSGAAQYNSIDEPTAHFIAKPNIEVTSKGNEISVEFDDGGDYVTYNLFFEVDDAISAPFERADRYTKTQIFTPRQAGANTVSSVKNGKPRLTYVIPVNDAGKRYRVKVEASSSGQVSGLATVSSDIKSVPTRPPFEIIEISENKIQLSWEGLASNSENPYKIDIYQRANDDVEDRKIATISNSIKHYLVNTPTSVTKYWIVVNYTETGESVQSEEITYNPDIVNVTPGAIQNIKTSYPRTYNGQSNMLELSWDVFKYTNSETGKTEIYRDTLYDVLITDDIELINDKTLSIESDIKFNAEMDDITSDSMGRFYAQYLTAIRGNDNSINSYAVADLKENQIYYARVLGKIVTNSQTLVSEPSTISFYITPTGILYLPAVLPKPPLVKREITSTSISIEWNKAWYEVIYTGTNSGEAKTWSSKIYSYGGKNFSTLEEAQREAGADVDRVTETDVSTVAKAYEWCSSHSDYVYRQVGFDDDQIHYESAIILNNNETLSSLEQLVESYKSPNANWSEVPVFNDPDDNTIIWTKFDGLKKNSSYIIIMRAYKTNEVGERIEALEPTGIILSTTVDQEVIEPVPTVPVLLLHETQDINAKIKWKVNTSLNYEVRYSKVEDVENAEPIIITNEMVNKMGAPIENGYYILDVVDLFPETGYFFWLKAKQTTGDKESTWSNPLAFITSELVPKPIVPPTGIGTAAITKPVGNDYITVEWARTDEDIALDSYTGTRVTKAISYIFEIANNIKFLDAKRVEIASDTPTTSGDFETLSKTMVKALGLSGNSRYYIRLKTRIVCDGSDAGEHIEKESAWSLVKIFRTRSENEYDSDYESLAVPMADKTTKSYSGNTVRIDITNDERVINDFVKLEEFKYVFDFSDEKAQYKTKEAFIPINVLKAMQNRDISLVINTDGFSMQVNAKAFDNADYQRLSRAGGVTGLVVRVKDDNSIYPIKVDSKELSANFTTKYGDVATKYLEDYMDIAFDVSNATYYSKNTPVGMTYDKDDRNPSWQTAKDSYNLGNELIFKVGKMCCVGANY